MKHIVDYLRLTDSAVHEEHLEVIRDCYRQTLQLRADDPLPENPAEDAITEVARQLELQIETNETRDYLRECVRFADINDAKDIVSAKLAGEVEPMNEIIFEPIDTPVRLTSNMQQHRPSVLPNVSSVTEIDCLLSVKMQAEEVYQFIQTFLFQDAKALHQPITTSPMSQLVYSNEQFCLMNGCLLDLFIRKRLHDRDTIESSNPRIATRFRLIEPISSTDDFSTWQYDHLCNLFDLEISPHGINARFPHQWRLANNAQIYCSVYSNHPTQSTSSTLHADRPRTVSLQAFVEDVCAHENNGQGNAWFAALSKEDISTYGHLANLRQSEWDNIRQLSMNAKKTLKAAVDRERENVDCDRRRRTIPNDSDKKDDEDDDDIIQNHTQGTSYSRSELLAKLHLIKLFISYTLRDEQIIRRRGALPRLEAACLQKAIDEMREEGFADDGLFPKMAEFFLPLTISERELCIERGLDKQKRQKLEEDCRNLHILIDKKVEEYEGQYRIFWTYDENITRLKNERNNAQNSYSRKRSSMAERTSEERQQQQAEALQKLDQRWRGQKADFTRKIRQEENLKDDLENVIKKLEKEIDEENAKLESMKRELDVSTKYVNKKLIKLPRGLIMYGPPGTGKSDIMSKLAVKLGILSVGPPLAAGELNRPLVGESERIIIALCQRCYRVPYAMCCVSIDEIDSLAPKRNEDSSEGKVDKISVLLSLIEGIKDVPNLMILSATNRLHMMDEAFLRRMSGKFFVGRPSSDARIKILQDIPNCAMAPGLLDRLSIATTNFSGAAVRALTASMTVKCLSARRSNPTYQVNYKEALETADRVAQQYQIFFGSETLPRLLLRQLHTESALQVRPLSNQWNYTGRIIVDFCTASVRIERCSQRNHSTSYSILEDELRRDEKNVQSLLERLSVYGKSRNVQLLQLVDLNLLASQNAYDEKKVFETLKDRYDECVAYTRSMIVYDLDALVGVNKSESDSNMGRSTSSSVVNQRIYTYVRARFRDSAIEDKQGNADDKIERWVVAIIREPFLLRQFCDDVEFTRTPKEERELELERRRAEELIKCVKCKDVYIEHENKMGNCVHHDGFVYDNSASDLTIYTPTEAILLLNKIECDLIRTTDGREELERQKNKFKWICCDAVLVSGNVGGCKKGKHGFMMNTADEQGRAPDDTTDRSEQGTIEQWEEACRTSEYYIERWLKLLGTRD